MSMIDENAVVDNAVSAVAAAETSPVRGMELERRREDDEEEEEATGRASGRLEFGKDATDGAMAT